MKRFVEVCWRRCLKVNLGKSNVMVLNGEKGLVCEVHVDVMRLDQVSEFKHFGCALNELVTDDSQCRRKVAIGRRVTGANSSMVNARF